MTKKEKVYKDAPPKDSLMLTVSRAKGKYWEPETTAQMTEFMEIGMLPDYQLHINFSTGGAKRRSNYRIDIEERDFPVVLEMLVNIGGPRFRECLRIMALRSIAKYPKEIDRLYHDMKKAHEAAQTPRETGSDGTSGTQEDPRDSDRGPDQAAK